MSAVRLGFSTVILFIFFAVVTAIIIAIVAAVVVGTRARKENISRPSADLPIPAEMPDASAAKKSLAEKRDVLSGENEKPNRITEKGSIVYDGYAVFCIV